MRLAALPLSLAAGLPLAPSANALQEVCFEQTDYLIDAGGVAPAWVELEDIDGDGRLDLIVLDPAAPALDYLPGVGDGLFGPVTDSPTGGSPSTFALGDMTGNGELDAVVTYELASRVGIHAGVGNGRFELALLQSSPTAPRTVELADFDLDGALDIALGHTVSGDVQVLFGDGRGGLVDSFTAPAPGSVPQLALADLDVDGDQDIVGAQDEFVFKPFVLINEQDRTFTDAGNSFLSGDPVWVALGDIDEDGLPDLVAPADDGLESIIEPAFGQGNGKFKESFTLIALADFNELGDFDGDGHLDSIQKVSFEPVSISRGNGDGSFQFSTETALQDATRLAVADLDGDGLDDFVAAGTFPGGLSVMLSQAGGGSFGPSLSACPVQISLSAGGTSRMMLHAGPGFEGEVYWLVGSATGTSPGLTGGGFTLPLNYDVYMQFTLSTANLWIQESLATLDPMGAAEATLTLPAGFDPTLAGLNLHHAYALLELAPLAPTFVSNPVPLTFVP